MHSNYISNIQTMLRKYYIRFLYLCVNKKVRTSVSCKYANVREIWLLGQRSLHSFLKT